MPDLDRDQRIDTQRAHRAPRIDVLLRHEERLGQLLDQRLRRDGRGGLHAGSRPERAGVVSGRCGAVVVGRQRGGGSEAVHFAEGAEKGPVHPGQFVEALAVDRCRGRQARDDLRVVGALDVEAWIRFGDALVTGGFEGLRQVLLFRRVAD